MMTNVPPHSSVAPNIARTPAAAAGVARGGWLAPVGESGARAGTADRSRAAGRALRLGRSAVLVVLADHAGHAGDGVGQQLAFRGLQVDERHALSIAP